MLFRLAAWLAFAYARLLYPRGAFVQASPPRDVAPAVLSRPLVMRVAPGQRVRAGDLVVMDETGCVKRADG